MNWTQVRDGGIGIPRFVNVFFLLRDSNFGMIKSILFVCDLQYIVCFCPKYGLFFCSWFTYLKDLYILLFKIDWWAKCSVKGSAEINNQCSIRGRRTKRKCCIPRFLYFMFQLKHLLYLYDFLGKCVVYVQLSKKIPLESEGPSTA